MKKPSIPALKKIIRRNKAKRGTFKWRAPKGELKK